MCRASLLTYDLPLVRDSKECDFHALACFGRLLVYAHFILFFFFQAEDGIRDLTVTGVQTCALPILLGSADLDEPIAIVWSDHMLKLADAFRSTLLAAEKTVKERKADFIFIAQKPRLDRKSVV